MAAGSNGWDCRVGEPDRRSQQRTRATAALTLGNACGSCTVSGVGRVNRCCRLSSVLLPRLPSAECGVASVGNHGSMVPVVLCVLLENQNHGSDRDGSMVLSDALTFEFLTAAQSQFAPCRRS